MDPKAGMPMSLSGRSMGLGPESVVSDVWFEERDGVPDELHVRVARASAGRPSRAAPSRGPEKAPTTPPSRGSA